MTAPLDFLVLMRRRLRESGVSFALTSGMACVHFGLQQTTKDSDWIIDPDHLGGFRRLLGSFKIGGAPGRASYRPIFGAPLDPAWMAHGWTSHVSVQDEPGSPGHHVDVFSRPPRVSRVEVEPGDEDFASRHIVAQMKKTDRAKDWPLVDGLGWQLAVLERPDSLLHLQDPVKLREVWERTGTPLREALAQRRPLLRKLDAETDLDRLHGFVRLERLIWECVNEDRWGTFLRAWKEFYRRWRDEAGWEWPTAEPFFEQHERLTDAARRHALCTDPLGQITRDVIIETGLRRAATRALQPRELVLEVAPPASELLP
ncbi:MAG: hypothetical protein HY815_29455 [Candidatus Riflebacteria bacterium]|nr:hypothetical protein [Candidatus Riflebacteria bacterium]